MKIEDFDKIYLIHLADRQDRLERVIPELEKMGLANNLEIRWGTQLNVDKLVAPYLPELNMGVYENNVTYQAHAFNCAYNHFSIIKSSYERGFNNILIFEDDIQFNCDKNIFNYILSKIPEDYEMCFFEHSGFYHPDAPLKTNITEDTRIFGLIQAPFRWLVGMRAYCLSREGMRRMIDIFEEHFVVADDFLRFWNVKVIAGENNEYVKVYDKFYVIDNIPIIIQYPSQSSILKDDEDRRSDN